MNWGRWLVGMLLLACAFSASALDMGEAMESARAQAQASYDGMNATFKAERKVCVWRSNNNASGIAYGAVLSKTANCGAVGSASAWGTTYTLAQVPYTASCSSRAPLGAGVVGGGDGTSACSNGCKFGGGTYGGISVVMNGKTWALTDGMRPTGDTCTAGAGSGSPVTQDDCVAQGGLTQCMKADGRQCAVSSSGKQFCWQPSEAGTKKSGNEAATKSPVNTAINAPTTPPANGGTWTTTAQGTSSTTSSSGTSNFNVTNWTSDYGSAGSGGGAEGDSGSGDGDGDDGDGDAAGAGIGNLYEGEGKTVASVFADFKGKISDAPIMSAADGFLGSCGGGGGSCPNETWDGGDYAGQFDLGQLCTGPLAALFQYAGYVFLACIGIVAFRWALL